MNQRFGHLFRRNYNLLTELSFKLCIFSLRTLQEMTAGIHYLRNLRSFVFCNIPLTDNEINDILSEICKLNRLKHLKLNFLNFNHNFF